MAYTPPGGHAVNFNFTSSGYSPPGGHAVTFSFISGININLTGQAAATNIGSISIQRSKTLTGQAASTAIGSLTIAASKTLTGQQATTHIGAAVPKVEIAILGQQAATAVPATLIVHRTIPGQVAVTHVGAMAKTAQRQAAFGAQANTHIGTLLETSAGNQTTYRMASGVQANSHIGGMSSTHTITLSGRQANTHVGSFIVLRGVAALRLDDLVVRSIPGRAFDTDIRMSWSDDKGATFNQPLSQSLGATGDYLTNLSWRRLGLGRDRIYALEYSCDVPTALTGAFVVYEVSAT